MRPVAIACQAMATRFEMVLHGANPLALRAAGEEAIREIERLEDQLSLYRPGSEIAQLNARAAREPVQVTPGLFGLLQQAARLHEETQGAFDITVAPLVRSWGFMDGGGRVPDAGELEKARRSVGMHLVQLDPGRRTVRFEREGVMLDLGAIGKGYAVEKAAELLREAGVEAALIHGGTSTVFGIGHPPGEDEWTVKIENPCTRGEPGLESLCKVRLKDESLSVSSVHGRSFVENGSVYGHVIDPRTGEPAHGAVLAAVVVESATESDALSTALLTLGSDGQARLATCRPGIRTLLASESGGTLVVDDRLAKDAKISGRGSNDR
jgi:thiamine biosynthesis lipoprotein